MIYLIRDENNVCFGLEGPVEFKSKLDEAIEKYRSACIQVDIDNINNNEITSRKFLEENPFPACDDSKKWRKSYSDYTTINLKIKCYPDITEFLPSEFIDFNSSSDP